MSFRTYGDYNDDNVVKTIENANVTCFSKRRKEKDPMKKILKNAVHVYIYDEVTRVRTTFEKLLTGKYFNWATYETLTENEMIEKMKTVGKSNWEVFSFN